MGIGSFRKGGQLYDRVRALASHQKKRRVGESKDIFLDTSPLFPGQASQFVVTIPHAGVGTSCSVSFKTYDGKVLGYTKEMESLNKG